MAPYLRQRIIFGLICLASIVAVHFIYPMVNPEWVLFRQGYNHYQAKQWAAAIPYFEASLRKRPDNPRVMLMLSESYIHIKNYTESIRWVEAYLELYPDDIDARKLYAGALEGKREFRRAEQQHRIILELESQKRQGRK
jgi:outer membrane protein assembly factor BamD (BamD/ComL family)